MISQDLPLIDLHRHLDGSVRLETVLDLGRKYGVELPAWDIEGLRPHVQVTEVQISVMAFIEKFRWFTEVMVDLDACRRIAYENVEDAKHEGIDYIELRFSPWFMAERHSLDPAGVVEAIIDGTQAAAKDTGVKVQLIGILSRTYGPEFAQKELEALLQFSDELVALDLAGDEIGYPAELFIEHFQRGREVGWQVTVHAGEAAGPESVWSAIQDLGAIRIGHAIHAIKDSELIEYMREEGIGVEANLTSNVQTSSVADYPDHPLRHYLDQGLMATINTDDPGISNIDLAYEYEVAAPAALLSPEQIRLAQQHAVEIAFLNSEEKDALRQRKSPDRSTQS